MRSGPVFVGPPANLPAGCIVFSITGSTSFGQKDSEIGDLGVPAVSVSRVLTKEHVGS